MEPVMTVEIVLPDGTTCRWAFEKVEDTTIDRLTNAVEAVIGLPHTTIL